ncbi:MAG: energy transducer TonB, partial [Halobacteriovoraceae bacterium]|nr:energy transducer TonB [Halobacteriovoraceae bacterium]
LSVLVDGKGVVRQVKVIEGKEIFRAPAVEAMKKFQFKPATMEGKNVAVRIRYTLRFVLEN